MSQELNLELVAQALERAAEGLRRYRALVERVLGSTPDEVRETLKALEGLKPSEIREACRRYRNLVEVAAK